MLSAAATLGVETMGSALIYRPLIGLYRHDPVLCRPGKWRVVTGLTEWGFRHFDAVVDDFGNLVEVPR